MRVFIGLIVFCLATVQATRDANAETCVNDSWYPGKYELCVSSVLSPQGMNTYGPEHISPLVEGNGAWCEGVKGNGIGQTISFSFKEGPQNISMIDLLNGHHKSDKHYATNGRIRSVGITSDKGRLGVYEIADTKYSNIEFPQGKYKWIKLEILSVYPGSKYQDVCVTSISPM